MPSATVGRDREPATLDDLHRADEASVELIRLARDRRRNREIAAELFLSEKTVENHLRNIFIKLGAASRREVAELVERDRPQPA